MDLNSERIKILDELAKANDVIKNKKQLIIKLAKNLENSLNSPYVTTLANNVGIQNPQKRDISRLLGRLRDNHFPNFSDRYVRECLPEEYKQEYASERPESKVMRVNMDNEDTREELRAMIKDWDRKNTKAKDIITKANKEQMEKYTWKCWLAEELAMLAIKMENEHDKHEDKLCKEYAKRAKMVRDSRFATDINAYEAIIVSCNTTDSLKNAISGEWEFKPLWDILDDMDKCRECIKDQCRADKCTHECHRVVRPMTTKGLKYAIKTNDDLKELDKRIKNLTTMDNDICRIGKILLENPETMKKLGPVEIKKLIYSHVEKDECLQCDMFLEKNPKFFDTFK
jgi:hypothetical protein